MGSHRTASQPTGPDAGGISGSYSPKDSESQSDYKGENILDNTDSRLHKKKAKAVANVTCPQHHPQNAGSEVSGVLRSGGQTGQEEQP